ncbi:MAG: ATP-dependent 6-phosphofructokinase [Methylacidiphilales bacterium]|nr:ATP-dependent 6-phosphofructokinase [Candidatus Methylacidiphilales bacterium]
MATKRIGVLTSGGDCPGLNAVIRGVVRAAARFNWEVIGFLDGYEGLLSPVRYRVLDRRATAGIMHLGGTILGTTNKGHFVAKVGHGNKASLDPAIIEQTKETLQGLDIEALICIGGDGSLTTALQLFEAGINTIGVPKTIDNDIDATAMTFGFDSAVACVVDALDRLHTTARSHKRVMVLEVMGRYAGWIALNGGLAGGADIILVPEIPFDPEKICQVVRSREADGAFTTMVVVAEGAFAKDGTYVTKDAQGRKGEAALGGIGERVAKIIADNTEKETRSVVLGHLQRGGNPTALDRILGTSFGVAAVDLAAQKKFGYMVNYQNYKIGDVPITQAVGHLKRVQPEAQLVQICREIGVSFGD